jgi:hypothetical protein
MRTVWMALLALAVLAGCSGSISTARIKDDAADQKARGLRYLGSQRVEITVYRVTLRDSPKSGETIHRIERIGETVTDTIGDPAALWEVRYQGALFASQTVTVGIGEKGAVKTIGLTSQTGNTPPAVGAIQAIQKGLETQRDFAKTQEQARIDELNRQTALIKASKALDDALRAK